MCASFDFVDVFMTTINTVLRFTKEGLVHIMKMTTPTFASGVAKTVNNLLTFHETKKCLQLVARTCHINSTEGDL